MKKHNLTARDWELINHNHLRQGYIFRKRNTDLKFWLAVISIMVLLGIVGHMEVKELKLRQQILQCQAQRQEEAHVWIMDKSCSEQLMNSNDGILRIKTK